MPLKISLSAPGGASLTLEVSERDAYGELAELALSRFPQLTPVHTTNGGGSPSETTAGQRKLLEEPPPESRCLGTTSVGGAETHHQTAPSKKVTEGDPFHAFCQQQDPMGDMRRLVVAAEGARRLLGVERVSARELGALFQQAGWPQPRNIVQTIRNAARSSFRWLDRVPGREGYYTVSERGRAAILK